MIDFILIQFLFIAALISAPAFYQAGLFLDGKTINHALWAFGLCAIYGTFIGTFHFTSAMSWPMLLSWFAVFLAARFAFFNLLLNQLRKLSPHYLGSNPMDRAEKYLSRFINMAFFRAVVLMVTLFFAISLTAEHFNQEHETALAIFILMAICGAFFVFRFYYRPGKL